MKLKATARRHLPEPLLAALDAGDVADTFDQMIITHLHVAEEDLGPATHYVQLTDFSIPRKRKPVRVHDFGIEVHLSKVTANDIREPENFQALLEALEQYYSILIRAHVPEGQFVQLFVGVSLDKHIKLSRQTPTALLERPAIWVEGRAAQQAAAA